MNWSKTAREAAAEEYGKRHWQAYASRRSAGRAVLALGAMLLVVAVTLTNWHPDSTTRHTLAVGAIAVVTGLVALAVVVVVLARATTGQVGRRWRYRRRHWR